jgi:AcrR family transcriptional regulator
LIEEIAALHLDFITQRVLQKDSARERLVEFFQAGFAFVSGYLPQATVLVNNLYGPQADFKEAMYRAYQPMFALVREDLLTYGIERGVFRPVELVSTSGLIMNIYLGTASQISEAGQTWLAADLVADFVQAALEKRIK